jgi:chorismate synthase
MMNKIRFLTAGESHGKALVGIIEGIPSGLPLSSEDIDKELRRRQMGYGRGGRMKIESDHAEIISGVRWGQTLGSPIALLIENKDWKNWQEIMSDRPITVQEKPDLRVMPVTRPRPGHADLAGALKYNHKDIRNVLERSSARETAIRVAIGAIAKKFLYEFRIFVGSFVVQIGTVRTDISGVKLNEAELISLFQEAENSVTRCPDKDATNHMIELINKAMEKGDTLGGIFEIFITGLPPGLGSYVQWDKRLNSRITQALMGIQAIKGIEIGLGFDTASRFGSEVMDEIFYNKGEQAFYRNTNNAGGIEGGMSNGMPIVVRGSMKPIPTLRKPLRSVDLLTKEPFEAAYERSDICAVAAASVIAEAMIAIIIADAFLEKFGGDSLEETRRNYKQYLQYLREF